MNDSSVPAGMVGKQELYRTYRLMMFQRSRAAFETMRFFAEHGSLPAIVYVGVAYQFGKCAKKNLIEAERWFRRASEGGSFLGYDCLGRLYLSLKRYNDAIDAFRYPADRGYPPSLYHLGNMYLYALGVKRDAEKAVDLWQRSSDLGNLFAKRDLGLYRALCGPGLKERWAGLCLYRGARKQMRRSHDRLQLRIRSDR